MTHHGLAVTIGLAVALTFTFAKPAVAGCPEKLRYTNAALSAVASAGDSSRLQARQYYMKTGFRSLVEAQSERCVDATISARWQIANAWLGIYSALDVVQDRERHQTPGCTALHLAEAREGIALSWLGLTQVPGQFQRAAIFKHAISALATSARTLDVRLPTPGADRAAKDAYMKSSMQDAQRPKTSCNESAMARTHLLRGWRL
ncbi:MAG: hypothetical protein M3Z41_04050 [Candidatus Eremiobacteraeota bacterium]|nr:hypothetical protein [Candidatus Eremiobacteraeota bacterium]